MSEAIKNLWRSLLVLGVGLALGGALARADDDEPLVPPEPDDETAAIASDSGPSLFPGYGTTRLVNGRFVQQTAPSEPSQSETPNVPSTTSPSASDRQFNSLSSLVSAAQQAGAIRVNTTAPSETLNVSQQVNPPLDLVGALQQSSSVQTVNNQLRNPVALDPRVRGYRYAQIYTQADGGFWLPVRQDLDTPLSMIDPTIVQQAEVVPGPYALRYGPGFSYLNVVTAPTPRYDSYEAARELEHDLLWQRRPARMPRSAFTAATRTGVSAFCMPRATATLI